ncbi:MAG: hypothetical protein ACRD0L_07225, partial [Acidimicrobiales bacterium]
MGGGQGLRRVPGESELIKLDAPASFVLPDLTRVIRDAAVTVLAPRQLTAVYWDTSDLGLARAGVTVRHRVEDGGPGRWTVSLPGGGNARREVDVAAGRGGVPGG